MNSKSTAFVITLRPRDGVNARIVRAFIKFLRRYTIYYHIVAETLNSNRFLHSVLYLKTPVSKSNLNIMFVRCLKRLGLDDDEITVARHGVKVLYNNDYVDSFLRLKTNTFLVASNLPVRNVLNGFYLTYNHAEMQKAKKHRVDYLASRNDQSSRKRQRMEEQREFRTRHHYYFSSDLL